MPSALPPGGRGVGYLGVALAWGFVAVGSYVTLRRPDRRTGVLMIAVGLVTLTAGLQFSDAALPWLAGVLTDTLVLAVFVHLLLAFPSGRLETVAERLVVGGGYVVATLLQLPPLLFGLEYNCAGSDCPRNLLRIAREPDVAATFSTAQTLAELVVIACALVLLAQRWRAASPAQRRGLEPVLRAGRGDRRPRRGLLRRCRNSTWRAASRRCSSCPRSPCCRWPFSPGSCAAASSAPPRSRA